MNKILLAIVVMFAAVAVPGQDAAANTQSVITTLFSDGTTNTWTQADLVAALQLINRKYHRDCQTGGGRAAWHGKMREVVTTNGTDLIKTEIHEDGQVFCFTGVVKTAQAQVAASNARLTTTVNSRGVPAALAAARARRAAEKAGAVSNVTVTVEANVR